MKKTTLFGLALAALTLSACVPLLRPCDGSDYPSFYRDSLIRRVTLAEVKRKLIAGTDLGTLPPEARSGVIQSAEKSIEEFRAKTLPTDELWSYRYEKCTGCGWYTEGIVALRGSCIAAELTMSDDM